MNSERKNTAPSSIAQGKAIAIVEGKRARQAESRKKLNELFNSLMQRAFTGEFVA